MESNTNHTQHSTVSGPSTSIPFTISTPISTAASSSNIHASAIPYSIKVGGRDIYIHTDQNTCMELAAAKRVACYKAERQLIQLDNTLPTQFVKESLTHEILHAVWEILNLDGLTMTFKSSTVPYDDFEEIFINTIDPLLTQVLTENPALLDYYRS